MPRTRYYALGVLALVAMLSTADQAILIVTLPSIQAEFHLADAQVGLINSAFVIVFGLTVVAAGYLADRVSRRVIIGVGTFLWSLATLFTGLSRGFGQLLLTRAVLGVGESSALPSSVSIVGDYFSKRDRGRAAAALGGALQVGAGLGAIGGGLIAARYGWRAAFYFAAPPGVVLAGLALSLREPARGAAEPTPTIARAPHDAGLAGYRRVLGVRTFTVAALSNTFLYFAVYGVAGFIGIYASRRFGLDVGRVGALIGPPLLVSGLVGNSAGGWLVDWRGRRSPRAHLEVAGAACAVAALGMAAVFAAPSPLVFSIAFTLAASAAQVAVPGLLAVNQNVIIPSLRGSATAVQQVMTNLGGRAAGLLVIGLVADRMHDLREAFLVVAPSALLLAAVFALAGRATMASDTAAMETEWAGRPADAGHGLRDLGDASVAHPTTTNQEVAV